MVYVPAWLPEMRMLLSSINSPDTTVTPTEHVEADKRFGLELHKYAPTTNDREPPYTCAAKVNRTRKSEAALHCSYKRSSG
jgi:hypothetical protein